MLTKMTAWKVDKAVGNVKNDSPDLLRPDNVIVGAELKQMRL
jgi:hypothetical protein